VTEPVAESKTKTEAKAEVHEKEPPKAEPKVKAPKPEPLKPEPPKAVAVAPKAMPPATSASGIPKPVAVHEPVEEMELPALTPEPKKGGNNTPFAQAMQRGQLQIKENDYPGAVQSFGKALSLRPGAGAAYYGRAMAYQHLEQFEMAMKDYSDAMRVDPKMVTAYIGLGGCLVHEHRDPEALVQFQRVLELKPDAVLALTGRGNIYLRRKQYRLALADYDKALAINSRYGPAYLNRARAREEIGDAAGAAADRRSEAALRKQ
jgi:Tfp pilus assembly protein PilF